MDDVLRRIGWLYLSLSHSVCSLSLAHDTANAIFSPFSTTAMAQKQHLDDKADDDNKNKHHNNTQSDLFPIMSNENQPPLSVSAMASANSVAMSDQREQEAKSLFRSAKIEFEKQQQPSQKHTIQLLKPNFHLTSRNYRSFNRWVKENHVGWSAKRREATQQEREAKNATNKGKSYWVDVIYEVPRPVTISTTRNTRARTFKVATNLPSVDRGEIEDRNIGAVKKQKLVHRKQVKLPAIAPPPRVEPLEFRTLQIELQVHILSFLDVPDLGACVRVSKTFNHLAKFDVLWQAHLQFLLKELFDDAFYKKSPYYSIGDNSAAAAAAAATADGEYPATEEERTIIPISERPLHSTEFLSWLVENNSGVGFLDTGIRKQSVHSLCLEFDGVFERPSFMVEEHRYTWLFQDVYLREYYKQAGGWAFDGESYYEEAMYSMNRCPYCHFEFGYWESPHSSECQHCTESRSDLFDCMPPIALFRRRL